jgi:hypothetical protein
VVNLRRERYRSRSGERVREPGEHRQIGVEPDALSERDETVVVLQASELALDGGTACRSRFQSSRCLRLRVSPYERTTSLTPRGS